MKKRTGWFTRGGALIALLTLLAGLLVTACPTEDDATEDPGIKAGFYAGSTLTDVSAETGDNLIAQSLKWLSTNAAADGEYTIVIDEDITTAAGFQINPATVNSKDNVTITLKSSKAIRTVKLSEKGHLLAIGAYPDTEYQNREYPYYSFDKFNDAAQKNIIVKLENIVLKGIDPEADSSKTNNAQLVWVGFKGTLNIKDKAQITGNYMEMGTGTTKEAWGAGVLIFGGSVVMDGGSIDHNTAFTSHDSAGAFGGGIASCDNASSSFVMNGGEITNNTVKASSGQTSRGGGIFWLGGKLKITGGSVMNNSASAATGEARGGGYSEWTAPDLLEITGGKFKDNSASTNGTRAIDGLLFRDAVLLDGRVDFQEPIWLDPGATIQIGSSFNPVTPIKVNFAPGNNASNTHTGGGAFIDKQIFEWAKDADGNPVSTAALPVDKFTLNKWYYFTGGADTKYNGDITEVKIDATGKIVLK
jgi:hypothetical protein